MESLHEKKVAVVSLNIGETLVEEFPTEDIITFDRVENALFNLLSGNVDALIYPEPVLLKIARQINVENQIKVDGPPVKEVLRGISVAKGNEEILDSLNPQIELFLISERYKEIYRHWYGQPVPFWNGRRVFIAMSVLLTLSIIILLLWKYLTTEKLILKRTAQLSFQAQLLKQVECGVIPIDPKGLIMNWNHGAERLFQFKEEEITGSPIYSLIDAEQVDSFKKTWLGQLEEGNNQTHDVKLIRKDGTVFDGLLSLSVLLNEQQHPSGFVCIISDNTERKALAEKKDYLIKELTTALEEIKTLKGLIPICSSCKRIRDDHGFWNQLETYIGDHSDATFSHSICPECAEKLYGYKVDQEDETGDSE